MLAEDDGDDDGAESSASDHGSHSRNSTLDERTLVDIESISTPTSTLRKRRTRRMKPSVRGYCLDSDVEPLSPSEYSEVEHEEDVHIHDYSGHDDGEEMIPPLDEEAIRTFNIRIKPYPPFHSRSPSRSRSPTKRSQTTPLLPVPLPPPPNILIRSISYVCNSTLPMRYMSQDSTTSITPSQDSQRSVAETIAGSARSVVDSVTYWRDLREAGTDSDLERTVGMLQNEWYYVGTLVSLSLNHSPVTIRYSVH